MSTPVEPDLSVRDVAAEVRASERFVREDLIGTGLLPAYRLGGRAIRVRRRDLDMFKAEHALCCSVRASELVGA